LFYEKENYKKRIHNKDRLSMHRTLMKGIGSMGFSTPSWVWY